MKKHTVAFSRNSSNLFFHILTKCNLSCKHCYINPEQHGKNTLDIETIKEWLNLVFEFSRQSCPSKTQESPISPKNSSSSGNSSNLENSSSPGNSSNLENSSSSGNSSNLENSSSSGNSSNLENSSSSGNSSSPENYKKHEDINVIFLGGEPTLHPDLHLAVKEARKAGFKSITIDTNGYLFHDILEKITPDDVDFISFSLDGATAKTNDSIRGKGSYSTVLSGIKKAVDAGFSTSMIYTASSDNLHELPLMPDLIKELGIERFFIQVIGIRGASVEKWGQSEKDRSSEKDRLSEKKEHPEKRVSKNSSASQRQVSMKSWLETVPDVAQKVAQLGVIVTYPKVFLEDGQVFECAGLLADNYFLFPNGRIYRCPLCEDYPFHSFEIKTGNNEPDAVVPTPGINESDFFRLDIPEGCVMNKLIQPGNIAYNSDGTPCYQIACCMLKEEISY
ncbi:MAG: radical SAM protein [Desulfamplus sp.]|nr:radical SAM protein [Desulfamplus sp.]